MKDLKCHEITLKSDTFETMIGDFDALINRTLLQMQELDLSEAEVTLKVKVTTETRAVDHPTAENINGTRDAIVPKFEHVVASVLKIKDEQKGSLSGNFELIYDPETGKFVMVDIGFSQTSMFDEDVVDEDYPQDGVIVRGVLGDGTPLLEESEDLVDE